MPKTMAPFPTLEPRSCRNPDCATTCTDKKHKKDPAGRHVFSPKTPWQNDCSPECRNRYNYIAKTKPKRDAAKKKSDESGTEKSNPS